MPGYIEIFRLSKTYHTPSGPAVIVDDFSLDIEQGEFVSVIGHSGCGKSTVLSMIAGLNPITSGGVVVANREIEGPGPDRGVVFQSPSLLPWMTPYQNVMLGVRSVQPQATAAERRQIVEYHLSLVGLADAMHFCARDLSQGMQQRVGIARAFALAPKMLLLDEPLGMLDSLTRMELQDVLLELLAEKQITTLMVTHDVDEALYMSDRVVMMTTAPRARIGDILRVPFPRPRKRAAVLAHPAYDDLREQLLNFLELQASPAADSSQPEHPAPAQQAA